jgi:transcriptional regulator with XRE-family HTH domain
VGRRVGANAERKLDTPDQALGAVITQLRLSRQWSHSEMADRVGYSERHLTAIEIGKASPTHRVIVAIAQVFGLRGSQLLARAERKYLKGRSDQRGSSK